MPVQRGEDFFEFFPDVARISGAMPFSTDGYLQVAAFDNRRDEEVTKVGFIYDIAEDFKLLTVPLDLPVGFRGIGCGYDEACTDQVILGVL